MLRVASAWLLLFAAGSRRLLLDASLPGGAFTASMTFVDTDITDGVLTNIRAKDNAPHRLPEFSQLQIHRR